MPRSYLRKDVKRSLILTTSTTSEADISIPDAVEAILKDVGHPLSPNQLHDEIQKRYGKKTSRDSVTAAIVRSIKEGKERFVRVSQGVYGLKIWENSHDKGGLAFSAPK